MNNFRYIAQLDVFSVLPTLFKQQPATWKPVEARGETNSPMIGLGASKLLRAHKDITRENWLEDLPVEQESVLDTWKSMQRLLSQARKAIMDEHGRMLAAGMLRKVELSGQMARAMVSRLDPGSTIFWHVDDGPYHAKTIRFHVPLVTNPGCLMYSGPEMAHWEAGSLFYFNNHVRHCAANFGPHYRLHLVFEMYRAEAAPDPDEQ